MAEVALFESIGCTHSQKLRTESTTRPRAASHSAEAEVSMERRSAMLRLGVSLLELMVPSRSGRSPTRQVVERSHVSDPTANRISNY
jgi:hypothetical protein